MISGQIGQPAAKIICHTVQLLKFYINRDESFIEKLAETYHRYFSLSPAFGQASSALLYKLYMSQRVDCGF
jgi:hypothetical protein